MAGLHEVMEAVRGCFARIEPWVQAREYVRAVSSDLPERNGWTTPTGPHDTPPAEPGHTPLTVAALKTLVNALHPRHHSIEHTIHWQNWRDRHRARARWHHQRTRLRRPPQHAYPQLT
ncbi:hypothetical protein F8568_034655 [Actinomadura sp. LD22]|uniref:Uncharacterized protein n=1 Tax=Actinomadura physcomitrii TaxID=2650748 RepID=A0A6I4MGX8_9ACTN|nr:hypothetical protein [Actinomadura physcomitrii]MWA05418.1 hypothetical protein [Actinomadura physcomitrii]